MSEPSSAELTRVISELRQQNSRLLTAVEVANRQTSDLCAAVMGRLEKAESVTTRVLETQVRLADEREELTSRRHDREMEAKLVTARTDAMTALSKDARLLATLVLKRFTGIPLTGNDSHGFKDLLASFDTDQIATLMETGELKLQIGQRTMLASILTSLGKEEEAKGKLQ